MFGLTGFWVNLGIILTLESALLYWCQCLPDHWKKNINLTDEDVNILILFSSVYKKIFKKLKSHQITGN